MAKYRKIIFGVQITAPANISADRQHHLPDMQMSKASDDSRPQTLGCSVDAKWNRNICLHKPHLNFRNLSKINVVIVSTY